MTNLPFNTNPNVPNNNRQPQFDQNTMGQLQQEAAHIRADSYDS